MRFPDAFEATDPLEATSESLMIAHRWIHGTTTLSILLAAISAVAGADERCDCFSPTFGADTPALLVWKSASGGMLGSSSSYFPICSLADDGDSSTIDAVTIAPTAIDSIQIANRFSPAFSTPGTFGGPIVGAIISGDATYASLGILAGDNESFGRSDIVLEAGGVLTLTDGFQASGVRAPNGVANLAIVGSTVRSPSFMAIHDVDVLGAIAVSSEMPTEGYTLSSPDVRLSGQVTSGDVLIGQGLGSYGRLRLADGTTLEQSEGFGFMFVGIEGSGRLEVGSDGKITSGGLFAGTGSSGSGIIEVLDGGKLFVDDDEFARIEIGRKGPASMSIGAGGEVRISTALQIGSEEGGDGYVTVGQGAMLRSSSPFGNLQIGGLDLGSGGPGTGALYIDEGVVRLGGRALIGAAEDGVGVVDVVGGELTLRERLIVGHGGEGTLRVSAGAKLQIESPLDGEGMRIGRFGSGVGVVEFSGAESSVTGLGARTTVGLLGEGTLILKDGFGLTMPDGAVALGQEAGAVGRLRVEGAGTSLNSSELIVGDKGTGRLSITGGGSVLTGSVATLGAGEGPEGRTSVVEVDGSDSRWEVGGPLESADFVLGRRSRAQLLVSNGGRVEIKSGGRLLVGPEAIGELVLNSGGQLTSRGALVLGELAAGQGVVRLSGAESKLTVGSNVVIGEVGSGELEINDGGVLELTAGLLGSRMMVLGKESGAIGRLTVDGLSSILRVDAMDVGSAGAGSLNVSRGGVLDVGGEIKIGGTTATGRGGVEVRGDNARLNAHTLKLGTRRTAIFGANEPSLLVSENAVVASQVTDVGVDGPASFTLDQGALWEAGRMRIGVEAANTSGEVLAGATLRAERLDLSATGDNKLYLRSGKLEVYNGHLKIGTEGARTSLLWADNGSEVTTISSDEYQIHLGSESAAEAELRVGVGSIVSTKDLLGSGRTLITVDGGKLEIEGLLRPGRDSVVRIDNGGKVEVEFLQAPERLSSRVEIDIGGELAVNIMDVEFLRISGNGSLRKRSPLSGSVIADAMLVDGGSVVDFSFNGQGTIPRGYWRFTDRSQVNFSGLDANGQLEVSGAAKVSIGEVLQTGGHMLVTGADSVFEGGTMIVSQQRGLTVADGGVVSFNTLLLRDNGSVVTSGGRLKVNQLLGDEGRPVTGFPSIDVRGGSIVTGDGVAVQNALVVGTNGELRGNPNVAGDVVVAGGRVAPGRSPGKVFIDGNLVVRSGSVFDMEIGGLESAMLDLVEVTGDLQIEAGGVLNLIFTDGFAPSAGDTVTLFQVEGELLGAFSEVNVRNLADGWSYSLAAIDGGIRLTSLSDATFAGVPEPSGWLTCVAALGAASARKRSGR